MEQALAYAKATGAKRLHLMAGIAEPQDPAAVKSYRRAVAFAAEALAKEDIDLLLEPINRRDMPGYFLHDYALALRLIEELRLPNVKLQFDVYHRQILHGDVTHGVSGAAAADRPCPDRQRAVAAGTGWRKS